MRCNRLRLMAAAALAALAASSSGATEYVLPSLVVGVPGKNGSFWDSEVRIMRMTGTAPVTVRRTWVAVPGGGFRDDQGSAPTWVIPQATPGEFSARLLLLQAEALLQGTGATHGAVGLEISGHVIVSSRVANTRGQAPVPPPLGPFGPPPCCLPGNGQQVPALGAPLVGPSTLAWVTTGAQVEHPETATPFRVNVGFANASDTPLHIEGFARSLIQNDCEFASLNPCSVDTVPELWKDDAFVLGVVDLPPWGWIQVNDVFSVWKIEDPPVGVPRYLNYVSPGYIVLNPQTQAPYYAYASVIYSPANDPEYVPAVPGAPDGPFPY